MYRYNLQDRLVNVRRNGALSAVYTYDIDGRRVRSWYNVSGTIDYVYSSLNVIDEVSGRAHERDPRRPLTL